MREARAKSVEITPGQVHWEGPSARVHRAVNVGEQPYEQVTVSLLIVETAWRNPARRGESRGSVIRGKEQ